MGSVNMHKIVDGIRIELTPEEEAETLARWAQADLEREKRLSDPLFLRSIEYPTESEKKEAQDAFILHGDETLLNALREKVKAVDLKYPI
jgi:hypothetical protein